MKKIIYIIPGWQESSRYKIYQSLASLMKKKDYTPVFYDIDWSKPLSSQIFPVKKSAIIFGFSLGAIFARLIAQDYECSKLILASMTPLSSFKDRKIKKKLIDLLGRAFIDDISKALRTKNRALSQVVIYGDLENEKGDIIIPHTGHRLNTRYNSQIIKLL